MRDLVDIEEFYRLEKKNPVAAARVVEAIRATCSQTANEPGAGRDRSELAAGVRSKLVRRYPCVVYFRVAPAKDGFQIQVTRVLHQRREVESVFPGT